MQIDRTRADHIVPFAVVRPDSDTVILRERHDRAGASGARAEAPGCAPRAGKEAVRRPRILHVLRPFWIKFRRAMDVFNLLYVEGIHGGQVQLSLLSFGLLQMREAARPVHRERELVVRPPAPLGGGGWEEEIE